MLSNIIFFAVFKEILLKSSTISLIAVSETKTYAKYWDDNCDVQKSVINISDWINISVKVFEIIVKSLYP